MLFGYILHVYRGQKIELQKVKTELRKQRIRVYLSLAGTLLHLALPQLSIENLIKVAKAPCDRVPLKVAYNNIFMMMR